MALTDTHVRNAKPRARPYKLSDGGGMYLPVWGRRRATFSGSIGSPMERLARLWDRKPIPLSRIRLTPKNWRSPLSLTQITDNGLNPLRWSHFKKATPPCLRRGDSIGPWA